MFENFTERARKVLGMARQEAQKLHHEYIGTEHILLGLIQEGTGVAVTALRELDIDWLGVKGQLRQLIVPGPDNYRGDKLPFTPRSKSVIDLAKEEAASLNHEHIGTEHLLLGLLREGEGIAAQVLMNVGVRLERVRDKILDILQGAARPIEPSKRYVPVWSSQSIEIMKLAEELAAAEKAEYVRQDHLLLALVAFPEGIAAAVLTELGLRIEDVKARIIRFVKPPSDNPQDSNPDL